MLSRLLHNLAMRQDVQQKLREEVIEARLNYGDMDWDQLNSLPYMEAVVKEVFRRYVPAVTFRTSLTGSLDSHRYPSSRERQFETIN